MGSIAKLLVAALLCSAAHAQPASEDALAEAKLKVPPNALYHLPTLVPLVREHWPSLSMPELLPGQIEKETCITAKHKKCWSRFAELKTSREYGFGLPQLTIAYNADGTERFNSFNDARNLSPELADWRFEDRFDGRKQLLTVVLRDKMEYARITGAETEQDRLTFFLVSYNGGAGGLMKDRRLCAAQPGKVCNPNKWFGNVELYSYKSKVAQPGYGRSFFEISRSYPKDILFNRAPKYKPFFQPEYPDKQIKE